MVDAMLGRLARWLRILGCDALFEAEILDAELVRLAAAEAAWGDPQVEVGPKLSLADAERVLTHFGSRAR